MADRIIWNSEGESSAKHQNFDYTVGERKAGDQGKVWAKVAHPHSFILTLTLSSF